MQYIFEILSTYKFEGEEVVSETATSFTLEGSSFMHDGSREREEIFVGLQQTLGGKRAWACGVVSVFHIARTNYAEE